MFTRSTVAEKRKEWRDQSGGGSLIRELHDLALGGRVRKEKRGNIASTKGKEKERRDSGT